MSNLNQHADRGADGKLLRSKFRCHHGPRFPSGTPKWWRKLHMTRPQRHANAACCVRIVKGADPDGMAFPLGNHSRTCTTGDVMPLCCLRVGDRQSPASPFAVGDVRRVRPQRQHVYRHHGM